MDFDTSGIESGLMYCTFPHVNTGHKLCSIFWGCRLIIKKMLIRLFRYILQRPWLYLWLSLYGYVRARMCGHGRMRMRAHTCDASKSVIVTGWSSASFCHKIYFSLCVIPLLALRWYTTKPQVITTANMGAGYSRCLAVILPWGAQRNNPWRARYGTFSVGPLRLGLKLHLRCWPCMSYAISCRIIPRYIGCRLFRWLASKYVSSF